MIWEFNGLSLDKELAELNGPDGQVHIERYPFDLLVYLIENADKVVSNDELMAMVWSGRVVSDSAISTAVKQARKAVGDTGTEKTIIKTVRGRGFRFIASLNNRKSTVSPSFSTIREDVPAAEALTIRAGRGRPSIAVLRFRQLGGESLTSTLSDGFPAELISSLARLRWIHVIARASSFHFTPYDLMAEDIGKKLGVRYLVSGMVEQVQNNLSIYVEVQSTEDGALIWSDHFAANASEIHTSRQRITASIVAALELAIPDYEAAHSRDLSVAEFDAWSHFHLGLTHIYKYNQGDNLIAAQHFQAALKLDSEFCRAHAGMSFTHWQNAFMQFGENRNQLIELAAESAADAIDIDGNDPFANFNMGRVRWLEGDTEGSKHWLNRALQVNPNFAQCHYNKGIILAFDGCSKEALQATDLAISLSPLDPLLYGMLCVKATASIAMDDFDQASRFADRAAQSPGAHFYVHLIAACANELAGNKIAAERWRKRAIHTRPDVSVAMFMASHPFRQSEMQAKMSGSLLRLGLK